MASISLLSTQESIFCPLWRAQLDSCEDDYYLEQYLRAVVETGIETAVDSVLIDVIILLALCA